MHTSCSIPIFLGHTLYFATGCLVLVGFEAVDETSAGQVTIADESVFCPLNPPEYLSNSATTGKSGQTVALPQMDGSECMACSKQNKRQLVTLRFQWTGASGAQIQYDNTAATLTNGNNVTIFASDLAKGKFETSTLISVIGDSSRSSCTVHTSCSVPIYIGLTLNFELGNLVLVGFQVLSTLQSTMITTVVDETILCAELVGYDEIDSDPPGVFTLKPFVDLNPRSRFDCNKVLRGNRLVVFQIC
jgi:hypothetical protein